MVVGVGIVVWLFRFQKARIFSSSPYRKSQKPLRRVPNDSEPPHLLICILYPYSSAEAPRVMTFVCQQQRRRPNRPKPIPILYYLDASNEHSEHPLSCSTILLLYSNLHILPL